MYHCKCCIKSTKVILSKWSIARWCVPFSFVSHLRPLTNWHCTLFRLFQRVLSKRPFNNPKIKSIRFEFPNPVGLAAGFDKNGIALQSLAALGFGFIEAGTVTYHPQPGNPRPRLFRLSEDQALINRAGFNNERRRCVRQRVEQHRPDCVLGVSIGKSKITPLEEATDDYLASFELVYNVADYVAVNVSSPNTPQLRELQQSEQLTSLLSALQTRNRELQKPLSKLPFRCS